MDTGLRSAGGPVGSQEGRLLNLPGPEHAVSHWIVDPGHSSVEFAISHLGIGLVKGRFRNVSGSAEIDELDRSRSRIEVEIEPKGVDTGQPMRDMHLRTREFFHVQRFPWIHFRSRAVVPLGPSRLLVHGELSLRGTSRPVVLEVTARGRAVDPHGCDREGFSATTVLDRRDFGMGWNQELPDGGLLLGNEVSVAIELELVRSDPMPDVA